MDCCGTHKEKKKGEEHTAHADSHGNHMGVMLIACGGALLLIFVLPLFGLSKGWSSGIAIAVMIILHFFMMKGHTHGKHENERRQ